MEIPFLFIIQNPANLPKCCVRSAFTAEELLFICSLAKCTWWFKWCFCEKVPYTKHLQSGPVGTPAIKVFNTMAMVSINKYAEALFKRKPHHLLHQKIIYKKTKKKKQNQKRRDSLYSWIRPTISASTSFQKGKRKCPLSHTGPLL